MAERLLAVPLVRSEMHKLPPGLNPDNTPECLNTDKIRRWKKLNQEMVKRLVCSMIYKLLRTVRVHVTKPEFAAFVRWIKQNLPT